MARLQLESGSASAVVDAEHGGRLASLEISGRQVLVVEGSLGPMQWGSYPMVPWAGRIRHGRFEHGGITHQLPCNLPPHSAHGIGFTSPWSVVDERTLGLDLDSPWPFGGRVTQRFDIDDSSLRITMTVEAVVDMPVMVGWHPWFVRTMATPDGPVDAELNFDPALMYELDEVAIPTGELITPPPGPWDNCFTSSRQPPSINWPGVLRLDLSSSCDHWVIYTEPESALCVEPQSHAPDVFNRCPTVIGPGEEYQAWFRLAWG